MLLNAEPKAWNAEQVRTWLENRVDAARRDQVVADKRGYAANDDYDQAAAEEWACRSLMAMAGKADQAAFANHIKRLAVQDEYIVTGVHDDRRFERHVRASLRKIARMTKMNSGFENTLRYQ
jgi:hypothetical protein